MDSKELSGCMPEHMLQVAPRTPTSMAGGLLGRYAAVPGEEGKASGGSTDPWGLCWCQEVGENCPPPLSHLYLLSSDMYQLGSFLMTTTSVDTNTDHRAGMEPTRRKPRWEE